MQPSPWDSHWFIFHSFTTEYTELTESTRRGHSPFSIFHSPFSILHSPFSILPLTTFIFTAQLNITPTLNATPPTSPPQPTTDNRQQVCGFSKIRSPIFRFRSSSGIGHRFNRFHRFNRQPTIDTPQHPLNKSLHSCLFLISRVSPDSSMRTSAGRRRLL